MIDPNTFVFQALQVSANPGVPTDANSSFLGFGLGFGNPPCLDASAFNAIQFTVTGDLGTCQLGSTLTPSQNNSVANGPFGVCTTPGGCFGPFSPTLTTGVNTVRFTDMTGGVPLATLDPTALNAIGWNLTAPSDGVTAPCVANFTVSDVAFVTAHVARLAIEPPRRRGGAALSVVKAGLDGRSSVRVLVSRALAQPQERSMTKTMMKMMLGAAVLVGVAVVSYQAGAAKAKVAIVTAAPEIKWEPLMGGPLQYAKLWGDRDKGPEYAMLLKMPAGADSGMHAHTADYHGLSIQGTWVHTVEGDAASVKDLRARVVRVPARQADAPGRVQGEGGLHRLRAPAREGRLHPGQEAGRRQGGRSGGGARSGGRPAAPALRQRPPLRPRSNDQRPRVVRSSGRPVL